ncbi:MAG: FecR domain-containing protein [Flavobacterium sp.]|uniref:FecR family protein n=1 Tax=Flavobacterium sp. TaxID=239 RepID=UPI001B14EFEF|nr:FecR family protein [Flavobacterium sp.]MBO9585308.1 FecR domain-containing protein [Flavobacterium sp.]
MDSQDINVLLAKHFSGEIKPEQEAVLMNWIKNNPDEYISLKIFFAESQQLDSVQLFETNDAWERIAPHLSSTKGNVFQLYKKYIYATAAAAVFILISTFAFLYANTGITIKTANGEVKNIELSDGSLVTLNDNSSITYKRFLWNSRTVSLKGEAFFQVKHDKIRPFSVNTGTLLVKVLGTSFVVKTTEKEKSVAVVTGKVNVTANPIQQTVVLEKNQAVHYASSRLIKSGTADKNLLSWKTKSLSFDNTPLQKAFQDIESCYHIKIHLEERISDSCTVTTNFKNESIQEILEEFRLLFGLSYTQKGNTIWVKNISCEK